jgi:hypothetical protein
MTRALSLFLIGWEVPIRSSRPITARDVGASFEGGKSLGGITLYFPVRTCQTQPVCIRFGYKPTRADTTLRLSLDDLSYSNDKVNA